MTKKEMFAMALEVIASVEFDAKEEVMSGLQHEIDMLTNRKPSTAKLKSAEENEKLMDDIVAALSLIDRAVTITELQKESEEMAKYSNQKLSAILKKMVERNLVKKVVDKKKSYFSLVG